MLWQTSLSKLTSLRVRSTLEKRGLLRHILIKCCGGISKKRVKNGAVTYSYAVNIMSPTCPLGPINCQAASAYVSCK